MDDKLRAIVTRIENSSLLENDKEQIYLIISQGLKATVIPSILKYMPKAQLQELADQQAKITVESYVKLIEESVKDGQAIAEIVKSMEELLIEIEIVLKEKGIE